MVRTHTVPNKATANWYTKDKISSSTLLNQMERSRCDDDRTKEKLLVNVDQLQARAQGSRLVLVRAETLDEVHPFFEPYARAELQRVAVAAPVEVVLLPKPQQLSKILGEAALLLAVAFVFHGTKSAHSLAELALTMGKEQKYKCSIEAADVFLAAGEGGPFEPFNRQMEAGNGQNKCKRRRGGEGRGRQPS